MAKCKTSESSGESEISDPFILKGCFAFKIPFVGLGTWQANYGELEEAVEYAFECGYRFFDTSFMYENECVLGTIINRWITSGKVKREQIQIATKLPNFTKNQEQVDTYVIKQLKNLQLDYIDIYYLHFPVGISSSDFQRTKQLNPNESVNVVNIWKRLEHWVLQGKIKFLGLSNPNESIVRLILNAGELKPVNVQLEIHPYFQQTGFVQFLQNNSITVTAFAPLGSPNYNNFLLDIGLATKCLPPVLFDFRLRDLGKKYNKTSAQIILKYAIQRGISVIPKSVTKKHILENISVKDFELSLGDMELIKNIPLPSVRSISAAEMIPMPLNIDENIFIQSAESSFSSSSSEEEPYYSLMIDVLHFNINDINIELVHPDKIIVRGSHPIIFDTHGEIERGFERHIYLPRAYNLDDIVAFVSREGVLTITTNKAHIEGTSEVPVYCLEECS